jgi:hypothetical protein
MKLTIRQLKEIVRKSLESASKEERSLLLEPDLPPEKDEEEDQEEASVAGGVAGYTLPLGAASGATDRKRFMKVARSGFGGEKEEKDD